MKTQIEVIVKPRMKVLSIKDMQPGSFFKLNELDTDIWFITLMSPSSNKANVVNMNCLKFREFSYDTSVYPIESVTITVND